MNWERVEITLPIEVEAIYNKLHEIDPSIFIAGGFVVDRYLGYPFKDVDLFAHTKTMHSILSYIRRIGSNIKGIGDEYSMLMTGDRGAYEFDYQGVHYQIIFQSIGTDMLDYFDIRMKEAYYHEGKAYFSRDAFQDIHKKEVHTGIIHDSFRTLHRALKSKEKYGFSIPQESLNRMQDALFMELNPTTLKNKMKEVPEKTIYKEMKELLSRFKKGDPSFCTNSDSIYYLHSKHFEIKRSDFDRIYTHPELFGETIKETLGEDLLLSTIEEKVEKIKTLVQKNYVKLLFSFPKQVNHWKKNLDNPTYFYTVFQMDIRNILNDSEVRDDENRVIIYKIQELFELIEDLSNASYTFERDVTLSFSSKKGIRDTKNVQDYLEHKMIYVTINDRFLLFNRETKKILSSNLDRYNQHILLPYVFKKTDELYNEKKTLA